MERAASITRWVHRARLKDQQLPGTAFHVGVRLAGDCGLKNAIAGKPDSYKYAIAGKPDPHSERGAATRSVA
jgi:hypothetical protein